MQVKNWAQHFNITEDNRGSMKVRLIINASSFTSLLFYFPLVTNGRFYKFLMYIVGRHPTISDINIIKKFDRTDLYFYP